MPILRGAVTFARYSLHHLEAPPRDVRGWLTRGLKAQAFEPLKPGDAEDRAAGFVELENPERSEFPPGELFQGGRALFAYRVETLKVPANALKSELEKWSAAFGREHARVPRRTEKAEAKEALKQKLRQKLEPSVRVVDVSLQLDSGVLLVWGTSRKVLEEITGFHEQRLKVRLTPRIPVALVKDQELQPTLELFGPEVANG